MLCEELTAWMVEHYGNRLTVAEHLPVTTVVLEKDSAVLKTQGPTVNAGRVVLCTNGFENFTIENHSGADIDPSFHANVYGKIAYMTGFLDEPGQTAAAICYNSSEDPQNPYYYLTRRPYEHAKHGAKTLLCIGGPERDLPNDSEYEPTGIPPEDIVEDLDRVMRQTYRDTKPNATRSFTWQGLMGHTPNRIRRIGFEPKNNVLLYNLGCNGVGILPSIYGGRRIALLLSGMDLPPSIFDPENGDK
jgi:glycine/D-amino acid oxidase-like deaminating enzyme